MKIENNQLKRKKSKKQNASVYHIYNYNTRCIFILYSIKTESVLILWDLLLSTITKDNFFVITEKRVMEHYIYVHDINRYSMHSLQPKHVKFEAYEKVTPYLVLDRISIDINYDPDTPLLCNKLVVL